MYPQDSGFSPTMKRRLILALVGVAVVLLMILLAGYGFVSVEPTGTGSSEITYNLTNQGNGKVTTIKSASSMKRLLPRGTYEVMVRQGDTSYFAVVKSSGFLMTKKVASQLVPEKGRRFIGDNPNPCMYLLKGTLVSYGCTSGLQSLSLHVPATATQATYALKSPSLLGGTIEGVLSTKRGDTVIVKNRTDSEDEGAPHAAYVLGTNASLQDSKALEGLSENQSYDAYPYKDGVLMVGQEFGTAQYFAEASGQPQGVSIHEPKNTKQEAYRGDARGSRLVIAYANAEQNNERNLDDEKDTKPVEGTLVVQNDSESREYTTNKKYVSIKLCGDKYLCTLANEEVEVFDVSGKKLKSLYRISHVTDMLVTDSRLVLVRSDDIMALDLATATGAVQYHLKDYTTCGIQPTGDSYTICLINSKSKKVALFIDQKSTTDGIDQKIAEMLKTPEIKSLSIYGGFISVSPEVGNLVYIPSRGGFGYEPRKVLSANKAIKEATAKAGIDPAKYVVKSTME
ncbi:MAG TPA: hypothetical protein VK694_02805 [Verrucomicrobiae bacterium]|nr:hypothetical protein [Verrucomicrobiae bacterium]